MKEENNKTSKTVRVLKLVADDVAAFFPYFLAFYLISLLASIFFTAWRGYFYWPAFNISVIVFALIGLGSEKVRIFWREATEISKREEDGAFEVAGRGATIAGRGTFLLKKALVVIFYAMVIPMKEKFLFWKRNLGRSDYIKLAVMLLILAFSLFQGVYVLDFFVLLFGLISVLFGLDIRISAGCALVLLVVCPILLAFNGNDLSETAAVYVFYFLAIAVFTGVGDYMRENRGSLGAK